MGGYRQDAVLADSGIFGSAELWYQILRTGGKQGVLQVTPFVDFDHVWTNSGGRLWKRILCSQRDWACGGSTARGGMLAEAGEFL